MKECQNPIHAFFSKRPVDYVKVGRNPCPNAFRRGPCVNIGFLLNPREYWPLIGQSGFKSSCSDG